jgi:dipeptidyl aminopeptidase/acylaminoacyl peptidase
VSDYRKLVSISAMDVSPDGARVAFVEVKTDYAKDKHIATLVIADAKTGAIKELTDGKLGADACKWAPSGKWIAYVSQDKDKTDQVFVLPSEGGKPFQITHTKHGVQQYSWSPSGDQIAYVTPDDAPNTEAIARHDDLFDIHDVGFLSSSMPAASHLWVVASKGGKARRLTQGSWSVLETAAPFAGGPADPSWSKDARTIAFCRQANADNSDGDLSRVATVDVASGKVTELTSATTYEYDAAFALTGDTVAYIHPHGRPLSNMRVWETSKAGGDRELGGMLDIDVAALGYLPDGHELVVSGTKNVGVGLWVISETGVVTSLEMDGLSASSFTVGRSGAVAIVGSTSSIAPEIYVYDRISARPRQITHLNSSFANFKYGKSHEFRWLAYDGQTADGLVTEPVGYVAGRKYPMFVWLHGGPEAASSSLFDDGEVAYLRQVLAGKGYVVFEPNYRGSDNLGDRFETAIYRDPSEGPASDVLEGLNALRSQVDFDPTRISIGGHSYGGHMAAWLIAHDHRWQSAVVADGELDWTVTYSCSNSGNLAWVRDSLGGTPWDAQSAELYKASSPITYAAKVRTPTLIVTGTSDQQVPAPESYVFYHALKDNHSPVRFVGIPNSEHSPGDPIQRERYYETIIDWVLSHDR